MSGKSESGVLSFGWLADVLLGGKARAARNGAGARTLDIPTDDDLLVRLQAGERGALDELMERHAAPVFGLLRRRVRVHETAEDLFQETWVRVVERCDTWRRGAAVRPWLYRIALNVLTDHLRREGAARRGGGAEHLPLEEAPAAQLAAPQADSLVESEERRMLREAVDRLPEPYGETVRLRYLEELSTAEVAEVLGCAEGTVKSRLARGLALLQDEMEKMS